MAQHDYIISDQPGAAFRADINNAFAAVATNNSGPNEPNPTYPYMEWADTSTGTLKRRNAANNAWIAVSSLDFGGAVSSGPLNLQGNAPFIPIYFRDGAGNEIGYLHNEGWYRGTGLRNLSSSLVLQGNDPYVPIRFRDGAGNEIGYLHNEGWYRGTGIRNLSGPLVLQGNNTSAPIRFQDGAAIEIASINNAGVFRGTGVINTGGSFIYRGNDATYPHLFKDGANNNIAGLTNAGALAALSDKSLKTSINDLDYGLAAINALRPVVYKLLSEVERADELKTECPTRLGFVAQDVQKVIPELTIEMGNKLALEQTGIIPVLVKAVQELSEQVRALQAGA